MLLVFVAALLLGALPLQTLSVSVSDDQGRPVPSATVRLDGPVHLVGRSSAGGTVRFPKLPSGHYVVVVTHTGYESSQTEISVGPAAPAALGVALTPQSMSALHEIAHVSTSASAQLPLNSGTATTSIVFGSQLMLRDPRQVIQSLDEIPGVVSTTNSGTGANRASAGAAMITQIRGALPYETQSLIDGHPASIGADGTFSPLLLKPAFLQSIEVAKGPGAMSLEQSASIGGTVNYRTLEPTRKTRAESWFGFDRWGGLSMSLRGTGTSGKFGFAVAATNDGTPGPLNDYSVAGSALPLLYASPPYSVNGRPIVGLPIALAPNHTAPQFTGAPGAARYAEPIYLCCSRIGTGYDSRGGLLKVRYEPDARSALTLSFLNVQGDTDLSGTRAENETPVVDFAVFAPPAGYSGSVAPGTPISFDTVANVGLHQADRQQLLEAAYRTTIGAFGLQARAYDSRANSALYNRNGSQAFAFGGTAWGGLLTCDPGSHFTGGMCVNGNVSTAPALTTFNGTSAIFKASSPGSSALTSDFVHGYSVEVQRMIGETALDVGLDRSVHESVQYADSPAIPLQGYVLAPGSAQQTTTLLTRAEFPFDSYRGKLVAANFLIGYASHFSGDGGVTWKDSTHTIDAPRLAAQWRLSTGTSLHAAIGYSVAPPFINLLSSIGSQPVANTNGSATAYLQNVNNGQVRPETALGYELGIDRRFGPRFIAGASAYFTNLRDLFLKSTAQRGTYTPPSGPNAGNTEPLYITKTDNLGHARYEGLEFDAQFDPASGFGFAFSGSLQRAYPYALPANFYATATGPYTTNLGVIPNINFQPSGAGYNGMSGRIPYAQGYAALTWRSLGGTHARIGIDYLGSNNPYNRPAFGILSAGLTLPMTADTSIDLEGWNLANAYAQPYEDAFSGVPVPLINGQLGATDGGNVGPAAVSVMLHHVFR